MKNKQEETESRRLREIINVLRRRRVIKDLSPSNVRQTLEELGSTFVKIGQLLSMRPDLIPEAYYKEFGKLRTQVEPVPFSAVKAVVEEEFSRPISEVFDGFEEKCIGSASIAQVHRARLKTGEQVVVKVQRPGIYETMKQDIELLRKAAKILNLTKLSDLVDFKLVIREFWNTTKEEMDFLSEADNLEEFRKNNLEIKYVSCPKVYREFCTEKLLVMEYINAVRIDDIKTLEEAGYDMEEIGKKLAVNYVRQVTDQRFFHADPHPGNVWVREGQIYYLDMGMMGRVTSFEAGCYQKAMRAVAENDFESLRNTILTLCPPSENVDEEEMTQALERYLNKYTNMALSEMNIASIAGEVIKLASDFHLKLPANMVMLCRGFMSLEGVIAVIAPSVNIVSILAELSLGDTLENLDVKKEAVSIGKDLLISGRNVTRIPGQLSRALDSLNSGKTRLKMTLANAEQTMKALDGMVHRLSSGVISAAFILGSAVLACSEKAPEALMWVFLALGIAAGGYSLIKKNK